MTPHVVVNSHSDSVTTLGRASPYMQSAFAAGVIDVVRGRGYQPVYECAPVFQQLFYEYGRLEAANAVAAGLPVPLWDGNDAAARRRLIACFRRARDRIGDAIPPDVAVATFPMRAPVEQGARL